jgi:iron complex transport system substrate-binding protein
VIGLAGAILAGAAALAIRGGAAADHVAPKAVRQVLDMTSRTVRLPARPTRILSLCTSAADAIVALGAGDRLVAIDEFSRIVSGSERAAVVGKGGAVSREKVVELGVDLAFVWWYQDDAAATLADLGVPVVRIRSVRANELPGEIRLIGQCLGCSEAAELSAKQVSEFLARVKPAKSERRVYIELYGPLKTVGRRTYIGNLLELAGGQNVAGDAAEGVLLSAEKLIEADPDVILCVGEPADATVFASRPGMDGLRAVRQGCVRSVDRRWLVAGPHIAESVEKIRQVIASSGVAKTPK